MKSWTAVPHTRRVSPTRTLPNRAPGPAAPYHEPPTPTPPTPRTKPTPSTNAPGMHRRGGIVGKCPATHPAPRLCALVPDGRTAGRRSIAGTKPTPWPTHPARRASVWSNKQTDPYSPPGVLKRHLGRGGQSPLTLATPPGHLRSQARPRALGMALGAPVTHDPAATCPVWAGAPLPLPRMPRPHGRAAAAAKGAGRRHHGPLTGAHPL